MPSRRRRSRRRTSRRSGSLSYLLVLVLVVGIGYLLVQRGVLPAPPSPTRPAPEADGAGGNSAAIRHLLGRQLGGSGDLPANLVALYQTRANTPVMRDYETAVAQAVRAGQRVRYTVRPRYPSLTFDGAPSAIRISATGDHGFRLQVTIANTPEAAVKETTA